MIRIDLLDAFSDAFSGSGCGLIVPMQSGVIWSNQTGGTCCSHPELEGIFIPLPWELTTGLLDDFDSSEIRGAFPHDRIAHFLKEEGLVPYLVPVHSWADVPKTTRYYGESPDLIAVADEAWAPVRVGHVPNEDGMYQVSMLENLVGQVAILTWTNSD